MPEVKTMTNAQAACQLFNAATLLEKYKMGMQMTLGEAPIPTGQTPKEVIWTKNKAQLYHYLPAEKKRYPIPILCIYALINRSYVLDLLPGNSLVEYLVNQGFDVYLLDWGTPGEEDRRLNFEHYVLDYIARAVIKVLYHARARQCTLLGYCMGGTMSVIYAALFPNS